MNAKELIGKEILDAKAKGIGKVSDIGMDMQLGVITHIVLKAGLVKKHDVSLDKIDKIGDKVILKVAEDELGKKS